MIDEPDWYLLATGGLGRPVTVCRVPDDIVRALGASNNRLQIDPAYAAKLRHKHNLDADHFPLMETAVLAGTAIIRKGGTASFIYYDAHTFRRSFHVAIKCTHERHELWVTTFHRIRGNDAARRIRKAKIIRVQR